MKINGLASVPKRCWLTERPLARASRFAQQVRRSTFVEDAVYL